MTNDTETLLSLLYFVVLAQWQNSQGHWKCHCNLHIQTQLNETITSVISADCSACGSTKINRKF